MSEAAPLPKPARVLKKAYENLEFLHSPHARMIRVLCELIEPEVRFRKNHIRDTIVFFGSARLISKKDAEAALLQIENILPKNGEPPEELKVLHKQATKRLAMSRYYEDAVRLSEKLTSWSIANNDPDNFFVVCSGGGGGIMEAANRGAKNAGGVSVGLNISLPFEQMANPYQTMELSFDFHYFFIRKFWFFYLAKALVLFPGGFGTMDEMFELLTLVQTKKTKKYMPIIIFGTDYWKKVLNFEALVETGTIDEADMQLFKFFDDVDSAFEYLTKELTEIYLDK